MKTANAIAVILILIGCVNTDLSKHSTLESTTQFSVDAYKQISPGMTRAEVRNRLGDPVSIQEDSLPDGPFWGPQEGIDISTLDDRRLYEEWQYEHKNRIYLIWFGDPAREKSAWRVIGKTSYPKEAVF